MTNQSKEQALMQMGVLHHDCHPACETCERNLVTGRVSFPGGIEDIDSRCTGLPHECAALRDITCRWGGGADHGKYHVYLSGAPLHYGPFQTFISKQCVMDDFGDLVEVR